MITKPKAIVFFDLDGTVLTSDVTIAKSTVEAIKKLKQNNIECIIATGRTFFESKKIMSDAGIDSIISMNGQSVHYKGEHLFTNSIPVPTIERFMQFSKKTAKIDVAFYNDNTMRVSNNTNAVSNLYAYLKQPVPPIDSELYKKESIEMLLLFCEKGEEIYYDAFPELTFIRNTPYCVDIFNKGGSKANGIKQLIKLKSFENIPTYAFGDGLNDIEMFKFVDYKIAMGNAYQELKDLATFVTDDNNHHGISNALEKLKLI